MTPIKCGNIDVNIGDKFIDNGKSVFFDGEQVPKQTWSKFISANEERFVKQLPNEGSHVLHKRIK